MRRALSRAALAALTLGAPAAWADGAFPEASALFLPADAPETLLLATNFGLLGSRDGGASFQLLCEAAIGPNAWLYQRSPRPQSPLYAIADDGLYRSSPDACGFRALPLGSTGARALDAFPDAAVDGRLWVVAVREGRALVLRSDDGGDTFAPPLLEGPNASLPTGVESGPAEPGVVYVTGTWPSPGGAMQVVVRIDGAGVIAVHDVTRDLGGRTPRLVEVDPRRPGRLLLRLLGPNGDALARSDDGGATVRVLHTFAGRLRAFLRRSDGTLMCADSEGGLFESVDGETFVGVNAAVHPRALAERAGVLYVAGDLARDGFALGRSLDAGRTVTPWFRFADVCGLASCPEAAASCGSALAALRQTTSAAEGPSCPTGGLGAAERGCSCGATRGSTAEAGGLFVVALARWAGLRRRRRARRPPHAEAASLARPGALSSAARRWRWAGRPSASP